MDFVFSFDFRIKKANVNFEKKCKLLVEWVYLLMWAFSSSA